MFANNLLNVFEKLRDLGFVKSKRAYACDWLGKGKTYLRDYECRGRLDAPVPRRTVQTLCNRLQTVSRQCPRTIAEEINSIVDSIRRDEGVCDLMMKYQGSERRW